MEALTQSAVSPAPISSSGTAQLCVQALSCLSYMTPPLPPLNDLWTLTKPPSLGAAWIIPFLAQPSKMGPINLTASSLMLKDTPHLALTELSSSTSYFVTYT